MKFKSLKLLPFLAALTAIIGVGSMVFAQPAEAFNPFQLAPDVCEQQNSSGQTSVVCQAPTENPISGPKGVLLIATNIFAVLTGIAAVIVIIVAGFQYIMSTGDPNKVNSAKNAILYALIGLVVAIAARAIIAYVVRQL